MKSKYKPYRFNNVGRIYFLPRKDIPKKATNIKLWMWIPSLRGITKHELRNRLVKVR